jgi:hypothetical protein
MPRNRVKTRAGIFSRTAALRAVDGRTVDAKAIASAIRDLVDHLGGEDKLSAPQRMIIHATALLHYRLRAAVERYGTGTKAEIESLDRHICTIQGHMVRNLIVLGIEPRQPATVTLDSFLASYEGADELETAE